MAAFDMVLSGIPEFDQAIDYIRLGDNVVFRVSSLSEFQLFLKPYLRQAIKDHRRILYMRFASHAPLVDGEEFPEVEIIQLPLSHRFETFTVDVHNMIEERGRDTFYVFDCLSELQTAWATDLMMGNFFQVTCPFLFQLDTVAFFPLIRGKHSLRAVAKIKDTTQLFFDIYSEQPEQAEQLEKIYVRPEKVWNRFSESMFLPHVYEPKTGHFRPLLDGVEASNFYRVLNSYQRSGAEQNTDAWDRFLNYAKLCYENGMGTEEQQSYMCKVMMSRDKQMRIIIKQYFDMRDYLDIQSRMVGTGMIGGKACGMLLARKILQKDAPDMAQRLEPHDSFYIGSDVFYTYIVENGFWDLKIAQRKPEHYFELAEELAQKLMEGNFSKDMEEEFVLLLDYYGQDPYIVRSSSILEDGFGNAFAGKYESVFCANQGSLEERLEELEHAIRVVYSSTMSLSALDYRLRRGLDQRDEQMALLVQRVSGSYYDSCFMPCAAGVGYSSSPYRFLPDGDTTKGMLRLVMGLGTSAVDRTEGSYPRLVSLDQPEKHYAASSAERHRYSQRMMEVISREERSVKKVDPLTMQNQLPRWLLNAALEHDYDAERMFRDRGIMRDVFFVSCQGFTRNKELMETFRCMLRTIQQAYQYPVDIEFTINLSGNGAFMVNLLQCRPLQTFSQSLKQEKMESIDPSENQKEIQKDMQKTLFHCKNATMGITQEQRIDYIIYVDPIKYYEMPYVKKPTVARCIGSVNWYFREKHPEMMLMVPGRIGTSSPELGVPVSFHEISGFGSICEIAESKIGYAPELSYGSHMFQDLVEMEILYTAIFETEQTVCFHPEYLEELPDCLLKLLPDYKELEGIIKIYDVREKNCLLSYHMSKAETVCTLTP